MDPNLDSKAYAARGLRYYHSSRYDKSILFFKRALKANPDFYPAHLNWVSSLYQKKAYRRAEEKGKRILCRNPMYLDAYYNLGVIFEKQRKWLEAEIQYKKCLEIDSSHKDAYHNLTKSLRKQGKYKEAVLQYDDSSREKKNTSNKDNSHGYLSLILGRYQESVRSFEKAIEKDSGFALPVINKSVALHCLGKEELPVETFKESFWKVDGDENWRKQFENGFSVCQAELKRFEKLFESESLGEINRDDLVRNIKAYEFIRDLLIQELLAKALENTEEK